MTTIPPTDPVTGEIVSAPVAPAVLPTRTTTITLDRPMAEDFLILEAELVDEQEFEGWHRLFAPDATYLVPMGGTDPRRHAYLINDDALRLEERVYHISKVPFPSQSPRSDTLHVVSNVRVRPGDEPGRWTVLSNQMIHELRTGDFRQVGLGDLRSFPARVVHELVELDGELRIQTKTVTLMARHTPMSNLTFLL